MKEKHGRGTGAPHFRSPNRYAVTSAVAYADMLAAPALRGAMLGLAAQLLLADAPPYPERLLRVFSVKPALHLVTRHTDTLHRNWFSVSTKQHTSSKGDNGDEQNPTSLDP